MRIQFHGVAGDVTGAAFQLTTRGASVLVDAGSTKAGQDELVQWFARMAPSRPRLIMAHGEDRVRAAHRI